VPYYVSVVPVQVMMLEAENIVQNRLENISELKNERTN